MTNQDPQRQKTSRAEAVIELERIEADGAFAGLSRRRLGRDSAGEGKITDLVFGVTRWRRWLDFLIDSFYSGNPDKLELRLRIILRMGLYELLMTRVPDHAVVNEAVEVAREMIGKRATGLVNGVLRSLVRARDQLPEPEGVSTAERIAIRYSHPTWMVERWLLRYGEEDTILLLGHNNERPHFGLRVRVPERAEIVSRLTDAGARPHLSPYLDDFIRVEVMQPVFREGLIEAGSVLVQDEAAGAVIRVLDPQPGERILDVCAAPGGKSLYIAERVGKSGTVVGVDQNVSRLRMLDKEAQRLGLSQIATHPADFNSVSPDEFGGLFDRVLVDAPCSGLGVLAKRADLRWRMGLNDLATLQNLQMQLLRSASKFVRPGGVLVYSTCTIEPEENENQVKVFLESAGLYQLSNIEMSVPELLLAPDGSLQSLPHRHGIDGAFAVRFQRKD